MEPALEYEEPVWSSYPRGIFRLEILKNGSMIADTQLPSGKKYLTCGRLPTCDLPMEHSSVSRLHAVIQFSAEKAFIFDLGSAHGTFLNKSKLKPRVFIEIPSEGAVVRFGESTRQYVISYPNEATKPVDYEKDPVGFLKGWLRSRGHADFDVEVEQIEGAGFVASICLGQDVLGDASQSLTVSATGSNKKLALSDMALQVCEELERRNLFMSCKRRMEPNSDGEDFEDGYFDRTKKTKTQKTSEVLTQESLESKRTVLERQISDIHQILNSQPASTEASENDDELDRFMDSMQQKAALQDQTRYTKELEILQCELNETIALLDFIAPDRRSDTRKADQKIAEDRSKVVEYSVADSAPVRQEMERRQTAETVEDDELPPENDFVLPDQEESEASLRLKNELGY